MSEEVSMHIVPTAKVVHLDPFKTFERQPRLTNSMMPHQSKILVVTASFYFSEILVYLLAKSHLVKLSYVTSLGLAN